ncbi:c-type cytochrome [Terriglobus tenax]|uniref:c-type cytochrome n=1 Tax=Terriglobus tenax TaxID=1111115 RepID=UPI0021E00606|nr:cytochrome c [Terriglobus tenax]
MSSLCRALSLVALAATLSTAALAQDPPAAGKENFKKSCEMCHGADGKGSDMGKMLKVKDLTSDEIQSMTDDKIKDVIKNGNGSMPKFGSSFNDAQIDELLKVIRSFKPKK